MHKIFIQISEVRDVTDKRVCVVLKETGEELQLPISQVERYQDRVYIPTWLARKLSKYNKHFRHG